MKAIYHAEINGATGRNATAAITKEMDKHYKRAGEPIPSNENRIRYYCIVTDVIVSNSDDATSLEIMGKEEGVRETKSQLLKKIEGLTLN